MPQGPGTYGTQKGRPKKKDKMVDPKKKQQTPNVATPPAPQQQPPAPQQQELTPAESAMKSITQHKPDPASQGGVRWETPGGQVGWSANQERADAQAKRFGATEQDSVTVKDDIAKKEQEIDAEVQQRMASNDEQRNKRLKRFEREKGLLPEQNPEPDTPFLDAVDKPETGPGADRWGGVDTAGRMEEERIKERQSRTGHSQWEDNQRYEEEQAQARQKQEEADAKVMAERMDALEDKKYQKYMADKEEYEISGFDGSMKEWEQDRSNRARYQRGIDDLSIDRDMSFEDWEAQDYSDRRAKKQARDARLEEERGIRRQEKEERRVSERERHLGERDALRNTVEARREARNRGLRRGTEEYEQFMNTATSGGVEAQREHQLAMEKAKSGDAEAVAEQTTEQVGTQVEGQVTLQGMVGEQTLAQLKQQGVNEQALQELVNDGVDLTNKSAEEIQKIISERDIKTQEIQTGGEVTIATGQWQNNLDMAKTVEDLEKLRLASAESINTANNEISRHQIDVGERLANQQLSFDAFSKELDTMLELSNNSLEAITQFAIANGQFMTPQMQQAMVAQILSMDEGAELARTVQSFYNKGTNLLSQDTEEVKKIEDKAAETEELQSRMVGDIEFTTKEEAKDWNDSSFKFMNDKDGNMSPLVTLLEDVDDFTNLDLPQNASRKEQFVSGVNDLSNVVNQLIAMPQDQMMKAAEQLLTQTGVEQLQEGAIKDHIHKRSSSSVNIRLAKRGFLQFLYQAKAGRTDLPSDWQTGIDGLGLGIQPITP